MLAARGNVAARSGRLRRRGDSPITLSIKKQALFSYSNLILQYAMLYSVIPPYNGTTL